jgi:hypothetical protein
LAEVEKGKGLLKTDYEKAPIGDSTRSFATPEIALMNCPQLTSVCGALKTVTVKEESTSV